ncbi:hypothetical protein [Streptomyces erythrochromogenes]|uniref:hypothetical protein n=1 Tax=Streptomyces erythrochromogenes TaxID=285574 RepID=UPI00031B13DA
MGDWAAEAVRARLRAKTFRHGLRPLITPRPEAEGLTLGTPVLAEEGCGICARLILGGPLAGQVWHLDQEFGCHAPESPDFRTWYTDWLEH